MIDLHFSPTANGLKAAIMLEETGLSYTLHPVELTKGEHLRPEFLAMNPVGRIPVIVDHDAPSGALSVYGSVAILLYLAEKTGKLMPGDLEYRARVYQWLGIVSSDIGAAYSGQFLFSVLAPKPQDWAVEHYESLCRRLIAPLEAQLGETRYVAGETYTVADVLAYPVAAMSMKRYPGGLGDYPHLSRWAGELGARAAIRNAFERCRAPSPPGTSAH